MAETMVERVARGMWERTHDGTWPKDDDPETIELYRDDARAAIAAMREPTEAMWEAHADADKLGISHWHAMIDEALK